MNLMAPLVRIPIGIVVERRQSNSPWCEFIWRPTAVLGGLPDADPWTQLAAGGETVTFYAGAAEIELYRTETENYRNNLVSAAPSVWVALLATAGGPPYEITAVTADPAEGEALTEPAQESWKPCRCPNRCVTLLRRSSPNTMSSGSSRSVSAIVRTRKRWHGVARYTGAAMSNDTDFLARWSRRKHDAATDKIKQSQPENSPGDILSGTPAYVAPSENRLSFGPAVCLQSSPSAPDRISAPFSKPGCLRIWRVRRFVACGR